MILFHRLLIGSFIVFALAFAGWSFVTYRTSGSSMALSMALLSTVAAAGFSYYLRHLQRFLGR